MERADTPRSPRGSVEIVVPRLLDLLCFWCLRRGAVASPKFTGRQQVFGDSQAVVVHAKPSPPRDGKVTHSDRTWWSDDSRREKGLDGRKGSSIIGPPQGRSEHALRLLG